MKAEFSSLSSRLSVLESGSKVTIQSRVHPVSPSPELQEDEVDREDDEISVAPCSEERVFLEDEESDLETPTDPSHLRGFPLQVVLYLVYQLLMVLQSLRLMLLLSLKRI